MKPLNINFNKSGLISYEGCKSAMDREKRQKAFFQCVQTASGIDSDSPEAQGRAAKFLSDRLLDFMNMPDTAMAGLKSGDQKVSAKFFTTEANIPEVTTRSWSPEYPQGYYDMNYSILFQDEPIEPDRGFFEIPSVVRGFVFKQVGEGAEIDINTISGSLITVPLLKFAAGLGWTDEMIRFRQLGRLLRSAENLRDSYYESKSNYHYNLLKTAGDSIPDGDAGRTALATGGSDSVDNIIITLDSAATSLIERCKDLGFSNILGRPQYLLCHHQNRTRIMQALRRTVNDAEGSALQINQTIIPVFTATDSLAAAPTIGYLMFAGNYLRKAEISGAPFTVTKANSRNLVYDQVSWSYWNAAVANDAQLQRVVLSS